MPLLVGLELARQHLGGAGGQVTCVGEAVVELGHGGVVLGGQVVVVRLQAGHFVLPQVVLLCRVRTGNRVAGRKRGGGELAWLERKTT